MRGVEIPVLTTAQRNALLPAPPGGMCRSPGATPGVFVTNGGAWLPKTNPNGIPFFPARYTSNVGTFGTYSTYNPSTNPSPPAGEGVTAATLNVAVKNGCKVILDFRTFLSMDIDQDQYFTATVYRVDDTTPIGSTVVYATQGGKGYHCELYIVDTATSTGTISYYVKVAGSGNGFVGIGTVFPASGVFGNTLPVITFTAQAVELSL